MREESIKVKIAHPREIKHYSKRTLSSTAPAAETSVTFSLEDYLAPVEEKEDAKEQCSSPMKIFADYSRFRFTLIEKRSSTKVVYGNVSLDDLEEIRATTNFSVNLRLSSQYEISDTGKDTEENNRDATGAYTQLLSIGKCRGMTPAQALLASADNLAELERNASWLKERFSLHKNNMKQYEAISGAIDFSTTDNCPNPGPHRILP